MSPLYITIPGKANTNHRPRATSRGGKVRTYKDAEYRGYLNFVRECGERFVSERWRTDLRYAVLIVAVSVDRRPRDLDNFAKPILDGLTGVAWANDSQIDDLRVRRGAPDPEKPHVLVIVEVIE